MEHNTITHIVVTDADIADLARRMFSEEVQGSRLDLLDYDHNPSRRSIWIPLAETRVQNEIDRRRGGGETVRYSRVADTEQIPFSPNPVLKPIQDQAAELFQDSGYTWTGGLFVRKISGEDIGEGEDLDFLYFQGRAADGSITWMDANGMDELGQDEVDGYLNGGR